MEWTGDTVRMEGDVEGWGMERDGTERRRLEEGRRRVDVGVDDGAGSE